MENEIDGKLIKKIIIYSIIGIVFLILCFNSFYTIKAGYRGVILTFGKPTMESINEGLHFKVPLIQKIIKMEVRTQKYEAGLTAASKDLQDVNTKIAINYHIIPENVPLIYQTIGTNYAEKVIYPYEQETNKGITSQFTAEELITRREQVRENMKIDLAEKLRPRGIIVEEVSIIDFAFSSSFTQAIENKVTAEQDALAAKNKLEQVKFEAQQKIEEAKGKAEAIKIEGASLKINPEVLQIRTIEKWDGALPMVTGGATPLINLIKEVK